MSNIRRIEAARQYLEIKVGYFCSENCNFCDFGINDTSREMSCDEVLVNIEYFHKHYGLREIVLSGGEPTLCKDFLTILNYAADKAIGIYLHTNAIRFSDLRLAQVSSERISRAMVSFSAHTSELYHTMSRSHNFPKKVEGLVNMLKLSVPLRTNTVITKENLFALSEIVIYAVNLGVESILITFPFVMGRALTNLPQVVVTDLELVRNSVSRVIESLVTHEVVVTLQGFPPCVMRDFSSFEDIWLERAFVDVEHQKDGHLLLFSDVVNPMLYCNCCSMRSRCAHVS